MTADSIISIDRSESRATRLLAAVIYLPGRRVHPPGAGAVDRNPGA